MTVQMAAAAFMSNVNSQTQAANTNVAMKPGLGPGLPRFELRMPMSLMNFHSDLILQTAVGCYFCSFSFLRFLSYYSF